MNRENRVGTIQWADLTVAGAEAVCDFYSSVVGWEPSPVSMGEYNDFSMVEPREQATVAGICHARGPNADLPAQWLIYITVEDLDASMARCRELGGEVISGPRGEGGSDRFCVIRDPAGAVAALYQTAPASATQTGE